MVKKTKLAQNPLILRLYRLIDVFFSKSDDERDFYLDTHEGFIIFADLDKNQEDLDPLFKELKDDPERYCLIPKLTFYEIKKIMEGFTNEKVYDIDTKEKLLDIIQSKEPRERFLEFIYDHHTELEKWQQYFQERSRIRIIEWLTQIKWPGESEKPTNHHHPFVFEEDLDLTKHLIEKLKENLFEVKVLKEIAAARLQLLHKAKTYYSQEALNPRPKRGRPPKQAVKIDLEPVMTADIPLTLPLAVKRFLYSPTIMSASDLIFSDKYENEQGFLAALRATPKTEQTSRLEALSERLATLRTLSTSLSTNLAPKGGPLLRENSIKSPSRGSSLNSHNGFTASGMGERSAKAAQKALAQEPPPKTRKRGRPCKEETKPAASYEQAGKAVSKKSMPAKKLSGKAIPNKTPPTKQALAGASSSKGRK